MLARSGRALVSAMMEMDPTLAHRTVLRAEGLTAIFRRKAFDQRRIRMEFFLAAVKLLLAAQHNVGPSLDSMHGAANVNGLIDERLQVAHG